MKFVAGLMVGAALMWLYRSERGRNALQPLGTAPAWFRQAGQVAASGASSGAQRVSEMIDAAPIPDPVKNTAGNVAFNAWATAESIAEPRARRDDVRPGRRAEPGCRQARRRGRRRVHHVGEDAAATRGGARRGQAHGSDRARAPPAAS